jgi:hypothetical protein
MGVDAYIFAVKAKECFYFDRQHNFLLYSGELDELSPEAADVNKKLSGSFDRNPCPATKGEVALLAREMVQHWQSKKERRDGWCYDILSFVDRHDEDEKYLVISDHDEPNCHDVKRRDGYADMECKKVWVKCQ